jgi:hypothetical protein
VAVAATVEERPEEDMGAITEYPFPDMEEEAK